MPTRKSLERTTAKERWWRRDYCLRSGSRGPPPNIGHILLARLSRVYSAVGGGEKANLRRGGGTPTTAKLGMPFNRHHGFMTN